MTLPPSSDARGAPRARAAAEAIVRRLCRGYRGNLAIRLWNGVTLRHGAAAPDCTVVIHDPRPLYEAALRRDPLRLADGYFAGALDIEGDIYVALGLRHHFEALRLTLGQKAALLKDLLIVATAAGGRAPRDGDPRRMERSVRRRLKGFNSRRDNRAAIAFHYDVSNDFYRLWLDEDMVYSCAYFEEPDADLDRAQRGKLEHICRKLRLRPGERLLDIGCGWGALVCWAARRHGVQAHGVTLSRRQYEYALERIRRENLADRVSVELCDYRDIAGAERFDKIASVGMVEHVGLGNLPLYFRAAHRLLKPGGLLLNHGITHDEEGWRPTLATRFINRYVFPDGELDTVSNMQRVIERTGFEIHDVEALRPHYALTLRHWVRRLEQRRREALRHVPESAYRVWRLYMAACALEFEAGGTGVYQILASRRSRGAYPLPLTRRDLYAPASPLPDAAG
jgi:cyclopropane-fatty-acyl-phospholipid synthase